MSAVAPEYGRADDVPTPRINPNKLDSPTLASTVPDFGASDNAVGPETGLRQGVDVFPPDTLLAPSESGDAPLAFDAGALAAPLRLAPAVDGDGPGTGPLDLPAFGEQPLDLAPSAKADAMAAPGQGLESAELGTFTIDARLTDKGPLIDSGVTWRVFKVDPGEANELRLVGQADGGPVTLRLRPGEYFVHAAYGRAGLTKRVTVGRNITRDTLTLNAGGLRLAALVGDDQPLPSGDVSFDIYAPDESGSDGRVLLYAEAPASQVIGLNAGIYQVISRYGNANAIVRADIRVEPGRLTEAAVYQKAARLTLKLVAERGGEARANTSWSVVTPAGESVFESVGAFPSVVLSEGSYTAIAKHQDTIYERDFDVEAGVNREIEVLIE